MQINYATNVLYPVEALSKVSFRACCSVLSAAFNFTVSTRSVIATV